MEMYSHGSSSSSSSSITTKPSSGDDYEVFLSFRGPDTRASFTDHLYHSLRDAGVHVFRDDEELRVGEEISKNLTEAINKSKISIPIFSKGYASSKWCLKELAHIADNSKGGNQIVMPIFYNITPFDVRHQTGSFEEAFQLHGPSFSEETVGKWKHSLKEVGSLKGWDLTTGRQFEAEIIKEVVNRVLRQLKKSYVVVTDFLVGVEDRVEYIKSIISAGSTEEKIIGMYGPGGIGKTTLAKIVYNQLSNDYEGCSFVANVRETSDLKDTGIMRLQNQLISDILKSGVSTVNSVDEGITTIKERLSKKKVLICFDDVSERKQLEALAGDSRFGPGSKIIITTRNKELLNEVRAYSSYEVTEMDFDQSLQLFSKLAFRRDSPPPDYMTYSEKVVKLTGGLPLALEVIGSLLHGKPKDSWTYNLEKLEKVPHKDVQKSLMISYEELDDGQKQMFLDVSCFFVGFDKTMVLYFWDSNIYPREGMEVLEHMSLLKIKEDNHIWMHDQLIDFGRSMTFEKGNNVKQENRSRSSVNDEAVSILKKGKKEERVEAMYVSWDDLHEFGFRGKIFASVPSLTLLQVSGPYSFQKKQRWDWGTWTNPTVLPQLRWLGLHKLDPQWLRIKLCACNLAILDLSFSKVTHKWEGWSQIKVAMNLKVLNLTGCDQLIRTPDLSAHVKLERLILHKCTMLVQIHRSISQLKRLIFLDLSRCYSLQQLPEEVSQLESLMELVLSWSGVRVLPGSVGNIKTLKVLRLGYSHTPELATAIGRAENLEEICDEDCCYLTEIPSEIGRLSSLLKLNISCPDSISHVPKLPESLIYLHLEFKSSEGNNEPNNEVPDLSNLVNLRELVLKLYHHREAAPSLLWWIGRLSKLETLILTSYDAPRLSNDLGSLSLLKTLHIIRCYKLQSLPRLPSSLLDLRIDYCSAIRGPLDISNLNRLLKFNVLCCSAITKIWGLPSSLAELQFRFCRPLKSIGDISNLKMLSTLTVFGCDVTEMRGLDCLENLQILVLSNIDQLKRLPEDLSHLSQLKKLTLCCLQRLQGLPRLPSGLESLIIEHCQFANTCINISNLKTLAKLVVKESTLREIRGLEHLENLQVLSLRRVSGLESLPPFPSNLKELSLFDREQILCLPRLPQNLVKLEISECPIKMLDVSDLTKLKELRITMCPIKEIRRFHCLVNLSRFHLNSRVYWESELQFLRDNSMDHHST